MIRAVRNLFFMLPLVLLSSCDFINWIDSNSEAPTLKDSKEFSIVFSGNVGGETHPCGCRHFPLGGLPQVAGVLHDIGKSHPFIFVDAGDMLFTSSKIPESLKLSLTYNAQMLAGAMKDLGLTYMVPGDQDMALGGKFLAEIQREKKVDFLISNLKPGSPLKARPWLQLGSAKHKLFLTGLVDPNVMLGEERSYFEAPDTAFERTLKEMKAAGYDEKSPTHRLVLISHAGMEYDEAFVKRHPMIDWVIGAHSQSFIKIPLEEGKTKLVQVLSRNHYLGEIRFSLTGTKKDDHYILHEMREERAQLLTPNPWLSFIDKHKEEMGKLQKEEQDKFFNTNHYASARYQTASSCIECHAPQGEKWQTTAHALAHHTLIKANEENNLGCLECHTLGEGDPKGFQKASDVVVFNDGPGKSEAYWNEVKKALAPIQSVRGLAASRIKEHSNKWLALDQKHGVSHNFANVQCLNCHDQPGDHPFDMGTPKLSQGAKLENIKSKCLNCHDPDQSPQWYLTDTNGKVTGPNQEIVRKHIKEVACPAI